MSAEGGVEAATQVVLQQTDESDPRAVAVNPRASWCDMALNWKHGYITSITSESGVAGDRHSVLQHINGYQTNWS